MGAQGSAADFSRVVQDMRSFFILIPQLVSTGPIKGAIALANALASHRSVHIVSLRRGSGANSPVDSRVSCVCLEDSSSGFWGKIRAYRSLLRESGERGEVVSISMCFSADLVNWFCSSDAVIVSSVRGNLPENYRMDYGWPGRLLAFLHLSLISSFDSVVAMTRSMAEQLNRHSVRGLAVIGNFVDEVALEKYRRQAARSDVLKFVFLASLSPRKQPLLVLQALNVLKKSGHKVFLDIIGDGPLEAACREFVDSHDLSCEVHIHGGLGDPYGVLASADVLVIPSLSEGLSRASLEALYLGVPCVLRDVDGNADLIVSGVNGALFLNADDLPSAMSQAAQIARGLPPGSNLLPESCRQTICANRYLELTESLE